MLNNPIAIYEKMGEIHESQRLNAELVRVKGRGCKRAAIEMRRATYDIGLLGKQFRDLSNLEAKIERARADGDLQEEAKLSSKRTQMVRSFEDKWEERQNQAKK